MKSNWCYAKGWLPDELCAEMIARMDAPIDGTIMGHQKTGTVDKSVRKSSVQWLRRADEKTDVFTRLDDAIEYLNKGHFAFSYHREGMDSIQLTRYQPGGFYNIHIDSFLYKRKNPSLDRKLSFSVQLTDPAEYEGGDLSFHYAGPQPDPQAMRQRGTLVVFPSFISHSVSPVRRGVRHALVGWYMGYPWR